jgi:hypothetical protein
VFKKLFGQRPPPKNSGKEGSTKVEKLHFAKAFELELSNMEDTPVYPLTNQLSVGSEIGNIVVADPSLSPRHATFLLQDEVVSVMDHGSVSGTLINGKKIDPGKSIILEETDVVNVGDLEIRLRVSSQVVEPEEIPEVPEEKSSSPQALSPEKREVTSFEYKSPKKIAKPPRPYDADKNKAKNKVKPLAPFAANALVRVFAVGCDLLLAYSVLMIFSPFDEFQQLMAEVPVLAQNLISVLGIDWAHVWTWLRTDFSMVALILEEAYSALRSSEIYLHIFISFFLIRFTSTLIFGMGPGEFGLGIRPYGNKIWARLGGALRVVIGMVTWPFVIFDFPAILSKKTFKEVITHTQLEVPSKFVSILGFLFYIPLMMVVALGAPLWQRLAPPEAIIVRDKIDMRMKTRPGVQEAGEEKALFTDHSSSLGLSLDIDPADFEVFADFKFLKTTQGMSFNSVLSFYQKEFQSEVEFEVFKTFDFKQLISHGLRGNFFLFDKYPELYNYAFEAQDLKASFKKNQESKKQTAFANEFINFTKTALSLDMGSFFEIMQTETLYIKSLMDYRAALLSLIEYKDFTDIGFIKIGDIIFMRISFMRQRPFDLIMPLMKRPGRMFKVTFPSKENLAAMSSKFYKFNLHHSRWLSDEKSLSEGLSSLKVFDLLSGPLSKTLFQHPESVQSLYGYYFETSSAVLNRNAPTELMLWKEKVSHFQKLIETIPSVPAAEGTEDPKNKLLMNMRDLLDALENNNREYFGLASTTTL